jgi:hypothetical protein
MSKPLESKYNNQSFELKKEISKRSVSVEKSNKKVSNTLNFWELEK